MAFARITNAFAIPTIKASIAVSAHAIAVQMDIVKMENANAAIILRVNHVLCTNSILCLVDGIS
jgi:hypothetical protein